MDRFLIQSQQVDGPATHVLVLGVGRYPHLMGGDGDLFAEHSGMGQLTSPPVSALAFARWVTESFRHPGKPLASVALLCSAAAPVTFTTASGDDVAVEAATFANVERAVKDWKKRGDSDPGNLVVFYFCGHGIANGADLALLMEDFGADPDSALESALDFRRFHLGMEKCAARQQCFFVDACRQADSTVVEAAGYAGRTILTPSTRRDRDQPLRMKPAFYSTFAGEKAYSKTDRVSRFTEALLAAFRGSGADDAEGDWWVDTTQLQKAVQFMMERSKQQGFRHDQVNPVDDMATFALHRLETDPQVPVVVGCRPPELNAAARMSYRSETRHGDRAPEGADWDLELPLGGYSFAASFPGGEHADVASELTVRPPYRRVRLEVQG